RAYIAAGNRSGRVDLALKAKVELVRVRILDMWIVVPVHAAGEEGCRCRQTGGTAPRRERIAVSRGRRAIRSRGTPRHVEVVGDQLTNTRPVAFDVLRHLADRSPIVIHDPGATPHHCFLSRSISKSEVRTNVGIGVVGKAATRVTYDVGRKGSRRETLLTGRITSHCSAAGI